MDMRSMDHIAGAIEVGHGSGDPPNPMESTSGKGSVSQAQLQ